MKIAFDAKRALNNGTGLGNHARILLNALFRDYPEHKYLLFSPKAKNEFLDELHGSYNLLLPENKFDKTLHPLWRSFGITKQLIQNRVDIYHGLSNELPFNIPNAGLKTVVTIHDLIFLKHTEQYPWADRQFYTLKTKFAASKADKIIAVSNETKQDLIERYKVAEKKITVIYPAVDPIFYTAGNKAATPQTVKYILNVSSFFPRKNHRKLIEAYALIASKIEEELWLVGGGNTDLAIQLIAEKKLQNRIKILSHVKNEALPALYQNASAFIFPSLFEGFGAPVLEALFSGTPVIATRGGAIEEAAGKGSMSIDPNSAEDIAEKILKVLSDETLRNQMIAAGLTHAATMTDKVFAEKTMRVYEQL